LGFGPGSDAALGIATISITILIVTAGIAAFLLEKRARRYKSEAHRK
jgi:hypothetical protein